MDTKIHHGEQIENALSQDKAAQYLHVASWKRSKSIYDLRPEQHLPPERLSKHELKQARDKLGSLLDIADEGLDWLYNSVGDNGCCVVLANAEGVALSRRGAVGDDIIFQDCGLWTGAIWSEESEGTNGIGTCIFEERPLTIFKDQHFHSKNTGLSCTAAPIFDHHGELVAVLDVSSGRSDLTQGTVKLISIAVRDVARRIETQNFKDRFPLTRMVLARPPDNEDASMHEPSDTALLAVDQDDLVVGATRAARRYYGLEETDFSSPIPLSSISGQSADVAHDYLTAEQRVLKQALARTAGNVSEAARILGISRSTLHRKLKKLS